MERVGDRGRDREREGSREREWEGGRDRGREGGREGGRERVGESIQGLWAYSDIYFVIEEYIYICVIV